MKTIDINLDVIEATYLIMACQYFEAHSEHACRETADTFAKVYEKINLRKLCEANA
jgi:hypothetical protein